MANVWLDRRVFHWAHQGGAREGPSNTLYAMRRARANGAHGLELDVHVTNDGHLVVAHDDALTRMTGANGTIRASTLARVQTLDPAHQWVPGKVDAHRLGPGESWALRGGGPADPDLRIPTLDEVLDAFPGVPLNLEIKARGAVQALAEFVVARGLTDIVVVSFRDKWVRSYRRRARSVPTAPGRLTILVFWLLSRFGLAPRLKEHTALQVPLRFGPLRVTDRRLVNAAHRRGLAVHVWTVDDPNAMHDAIDAGADGIMTDRPSVLAMVFGERPVAWAED